MKTRILSFLLICICFPALAQRETQIYHDGIMYYRQQYIKELLAEPRKPLKDADARFLRFYDVNHDYAVWATYVETPGMEPFMVPTHSGKNKPFRQCGILTFTIHDTLLTLHVYQILNLMTHQPMGDELFVPFNDLTNYETSYAGGRYIDLKKSDFNGNQCLLDFNKCYNLYCAYGEGFSCPVPPNENYLHIGIRAGEKMFAKNMNE